MSQLALYDTAREALAEAKRIDEVMNVKHHAERIRLYARQARDRDMIADAGEIITRAERKLGLLLREAKAKGQIAPGRPADGDEENGTHEEPFSRVTLLEAGISKKLSAHSQKLAEIEEGDFEQHLTRVREKIVSGGAVSVNPVKDLRDSRKKDLRAEREARLAERQRALPDKRYGVILADPEWRFEVYSRESGLDRSPDNHYPTSSLEAIKARPVESIAADDCVLFLWTTAPHLEQGIEVMRAWGFAYKSHLIWYKDRIGTGYWARNKHEILLIGTRGSVPAPSPGTQDLSVIEAPVGAHSAKPEVFHAIIERLFPNLPKIELNARTARPGWDAWGNEAPEPDSASHAADQGEDTGTSASSPAPMPVGEADARIRAGYEANEPVADIAAAIGRAGNRNYVKNRARVMRISSRNRQRAAASAFATAQNAARRQSGEAE